MLINIDKLRRDIIDYYGTAMASGLDVAVMDVIDAENASLGELLELARRAGIDLKDYEEEDLER